MVFFDATAYRKCYHIISFPIQLYFVERRAHIIRGFNITLSCIIYEGLVKTLKNSLKMELDHEKRDAFNHPLINTEIPFF